MSALADGGFTTTTATDGSLSMKITFVADEPSGDGRAGHMEVTCYGGFANASLPGGCTYGSSDSNPSLYYQQYGQVTIHLSDDFANGVSNTAFLVNLVMHEMGHALGLGHESPASNAGATLMRNDARTTQTQPSVDEADAASIAADMYSAPTGGCHPCINLPLPPITGWDS
jgi:hypothetical protein